MTLRVLQAWESLDDPDVRRSHATRQRAELHALRESGGWSLLASALEAELDRRFDALASSAKDDEQHRGAIEVIRWLLRAPDEGVLHAINEIKNN